MGNLILALFFLIVTALLIVTLWWRRAYNLPRLVHTPLPPYDIPDVILVGGVVVENRGRAPAPNVKVAITWNQRDAVKIHHLHVESQEPYILRGGGEQYHFATIRLRELRPRQQVFVYWAATDRIQPQINVTSYQPAYNYLFTRRREVWQNYLSALAQRFRR